MENEKDYLNDLANNIFGIKYLFPYQRLVISNILSSASAAAANENSKDSLPGQIVILPTGYGKSLCYMLPAAILEKPTIVLSPLLSLIKDQARRLESSGVSFQILAGFLDKEEKLESISNIKNGKSKILITNPESLSLFLDFLKPKENEDGTLTSCINHLVVDEAHTLPEWGETFRSALLKIKEIISVIKPDCVTAFTATATPLILKKIQEHVFGDEQINLITGSPDRVNLFYRVVKTLSIDRETYSIAKKAQKPLLIFCRSRTDTEITARFLRRALESNDVFFYHAGLEKEEKNNVEKWFFDSKTGILVATCAYGMGIDKPDIRTVVHRSTPQSVEAYLQEAGRGGRDGNISEAILLFDGTEKKQKAKFYKEKDDNFLRMNQMMEYAENSSACRRQKLLSYFTDEILVCSGCDICDKSFIQEPEGAAEILSIIRDNNRKLKKREIVDILIGSKEEFSYNIWYRVSKSYGKLSTWQRSHIEEAIDKLEQDEKIKRGKHIWKDFYSITSLSPNQTQYGFSKLISRLHLF
ncbi:MAG: RecQ family ATP-dependent DNA helicase [Spirochaetes bacterium]|nr:RecQ family ATP-dependent DNA helicase [Spirochaetota bacterium]